MYFLLGILMALLGSLVYAMVFWKHSGGMDMPKRMIFIFLGFPVVVYSFLVYAVSIFNGLDTVSLGLSYLFAGLAFMFVNIGRSFVAAKIASVLSKDRMAFAISEIHIVLFEPNAIYTLLVFILGITVIKEKAVSYSLVNTAIMYVSLFSAVAAILMGMVMNRALEGVENFKDMRGRFSKTIIWTFGAHIVAIMGLILAIYVLLPYLGE